MSYQLKAVNVNSGPQTTRVKGNQVENNAGGYVFEITPKSRVERFLILGTDSSTYYTSARDLTKQNYDFLIALSETDARSLVDTVVEVSTSGRAAKNSPAIFALAVAMNHAPEHDKAYVRAAVAKVCRTSTHLFEFAQYVENLGGWGRSKRGAVAGWYESKTPDELALQVVKYRQRDGWTHRDLLRLSHPKGLDSGILGFVLDKPTEVAPRTIEGFRKVQAVRSAAEAIALVTEYRLPWETVPTQFLRDADLWKAFVDNRTIGHTAILRNVSRMSEIGAFSDRAFARRVAGILSNPEEIAKGRLHPIAFMNAHGMYRNRNADNLVLGSLEDGFYASFANVEPANARTMLALDVSGSMGWGEIAGLKGLNPREASAAMATVTLRTEPDVIVKGFSTSFIDIPMTKNDTFESAIRKVSGLPFRGTDCSLPMEWAIQNKAEIDHFVVYTDNETYAGRRHPFQALQDYRRKSGINAKLTVVGMTGTPFTIADPSDPGMMDVVGFDSAAPKIMADFARVK